MREAILCMDIGGTNCRLGLVGRDCSLEGVDTASTEELAKNGFIGELIRLLQNYISRYGDSHSILAVAMGFPATVDYERRSVIQAPNIPGLGDSVPICQLLEEALGIPVFLERDVNLLLAQDIMDLGLENENIVVGIYFGTGIGNSIYVHGRFLRGRNGVAGELGHIPQLGENSPCGCGNRGCIEALGGGRCLTEMCRSRFPDTDIKEIYLRHSDDEAVRRQVEAMAIAVATEVNILDPDCVVLGGGLLQMRGFPLEFFEEGIRSHTRRPYPLTDLRIRYSLPAQENGVLGAGLYGWRCLEGNQAV